jgi:hypothetical protein
MGMAVAICGPPGLSQKSQPQWLTEVSRGELTSESEETTRINRATKRTQRWAQQDQGTSGSDVDHTMGEVGTTSSSMPKTSGVFDYAEWLLSKLSEEQRKKSLHSLTTIWISALGWAQP